jgi:hypothetical protein
MQMNLNEAKQILNDEGYELIDEGLGSFVKKARRKIFGANAKEKEMLNRRNEIQNKRKVLQDEDNITKRKQIEVNSEDTVSLLKRLKNYILKYDDDGENVQPVYDALTRLYKKWGDKVRYTNDDPGEIKVYAVTEKEWKNDLKPFTNKASERATRSYMDMDLIGFCRYDSEGKINYKDRDYKKYGFRFATSLDAHSENELKGQTDNAAEWGEELNAILTKLNRKDNSGVSDDEWIETAHTNESTRIRR